MTQLLSLAEDRLTAVPAHAKSREVKFQSVWVLVGFTFWFGFYLGAVIMHAATK